MSYDYRLQMIADIEEALDEWMAWNNVSIHDVIENKDDYYEKIYEDFWINDSVTGNASGSYTCNAWQAEQNLAGNWGLMCEAGHEFGYDHIEISDGYEHGPEWWDVTIRCYLLGECLSEVLDDREKRCI